MTKRFHQMDQDNCHTKPCYPGQVFFCNLSPKKSSLLSLQKLQITHFWYQPSQHLTAWGTIKMQNKIDTEAIIRLPSRKVRFLDPASSEFQQHKTIGKQNSKKQHYLYTLNPIHVQRFRHCGHPFTVRMSQEHTILCCKPHAVVSKGLWQKETWFQEDTKMMTN